ncbi:TolC family protein [Thermogutta sp.]|uniref:TolC family protein n=1 Tax=Thermogutta sp. TaxID=1962930 RepID=UPI003C7DA676
MGPTVVGQTLTLQEALQETLTRNPKLVVQRGEQRVSWAAWWAAQRFPTSLNPRISLDVRPWNFDPETGQPLRTSVTVTLLQPVDVNGAQRHRVAQARAEYDLAQWELVTAELQALIETYRLYETAVYRRERYRLTEKLAAFQKDLVEAIRRRVESGLTAPSDLVLSETEAQSMK